MPQLDAVKIVESFWADVWVARNPDAIDRYVVDDFVITSGGVDIATRDAFKKWVGDFLSKIRDFESRRSRPFRMRMGVAWLHAGACAAETMACSGFRPTDGRSSSPGQPSGLCAPMASCCITGLNAARGNCMSA